MAFEDPQSADEWFALCDRKISDAGALLSHGSADGAYQLLAEAAECATKGSIMLREGLNRWPDRNERPNLYTHDLSALFSASGLRADIDDMENTPRETRVCYYTSGIKH